MDQQRPHRNDPALGNDAVDWRNAICDLVNAVIAQHAQRMRSSQDTKRPIPGSRIVEVNAQRQYFGERSGGSVCVVDSLLNRPWSPVWQFEPLPERQGGVLMPYHQPIRVSRFVEQGRAKWKCIWPQNASRQFNHLWLLTQLGNRRKPESMPHTGTAPPRRRFVDLM